MAQLMPIPVTDTISMVTDTDIIMDMVPDIIIVLTKNKKIQSKYYTPNPYSFDLEFSQF